MSIEQEAHDKAIQYGDKAMELAWTYGPKVVVVILSLIIGFWLIKRIVHVLDKYLTSRAEPTLANFLDSLASVFLKAILIITVASYVGIETTSLIAMLGAAGLAVGLALQGSLANFAGGVLILFFKPFKVGDVIDAQGYIGTVKEIQIFNTHLLSPDNKLIIIPNGSLSNGSLVNINHEPLRRVDFVFGVGYEDDIPKVKSTIESVVSQQDKVLDEPNKVIVLSELADSSVNFTVRVWVNTPDYWDVFFGIQEAIKKEFDAQGISIPFPQRDVHLIQEQTA